MLTKKFFCPVNGYDCPYFKENDGSCALVDLGDNPVNECDDAGYFFDYVFDEGEDELPFVWEDEDGFRYDKYELLAQGYRFINGEPVLFTQSEYEKRLRELEHAPRVVAKDFPK